jgi:small subunit ribosomal protein S16
VRAAQAKHNPSFQKTFERKHSTVLMIRLARVGARKQPYYRVVVIEKDRARNGRSIEVVGTYNPRTEPATVNLVRDRIDYWVSNGAQMSDTVAKLFKKPPAPAATPTPETKVKAAPPAPAPATDTPAPVAEEPAAPAAETESASAA